MVFRLGSQFVVWGILINSRWNSKICSRSDSHGYGRQNRNVQWSRNYTLPMMTPAVVSTRQIVQDGYGKNKTLITAAKNPPIFEIPKFLTASECLALIRHAELKGLRGAKQMGPRDNSNSSRESGRVAQTTFIKTGPHIRQIRLRISHLTGIPEDLVLESEPFQVVRYSPGGYYHGHYDSTGEEVGERGPPRPCCQYTWFPHTRQRCTLCRYMTVLLYLNDVEQGGETAFPVADRTSHNFTLTTSLTNLSKNCQRAPVLMKPEMGKAVIWYNHHRDQETGWLGPLNRLSLHGGCDVIAGEKWIANAWINAPRHEDKDKHSIYSEPWR